MSEINIMEILNNLYPVLDLRYVKQNDCNSLRERTDNEINEIKLKVSNIETKLNLILKIGSAAALAAVGAFATALCSLILK